MPHKLMHRTDKNFFANPLTVSLRYRCACATQEVLSIAVVLDVDLGRDEFLYQMAYLYDDMRREIAQHTNAAGEPTGRAPAKRAAT